MLSSVDTAEQIVCTCAEMDGGVNSRHRGLDRVR
jgi:hypothetical protein